VFAWRKRIGYIGPGALSTAAYDFYLVAPEGVGLFAVTNPIEDWRDDEYERSLASAEKSAKYLASVHVDFIVHVGVPLVVSQGPQYMRELLGRIKAQTGLPASTTINSGAEALRSLGAQKVMVLSPFPRETHERILSFLSEEGFTVAAEARLESKFKDLYLISPREVYDFMTRAVRAAPKVDAVFAPCPQWHAFELTPYLELDTGLPFVSGDACDFWYAFKSLGIRGVKRGYGVLLDGLSGPTAGE
jgi:maleate isomerase